MSLMKMITRRIKRSGQFPSPLTVGREHPQGASLSASEHKKLMEKVAQYTGLSSLFVEERNLRITQYTFNKELLRSEHRILGKLDSRFLGIDPIPTSERYQFDPSLFSAAVSFGTVMNGYVRQELNYQNNLPYEVHNDEVDRLWDWSSGIAGKQGYVNIITTLQKAMSKNSRMKVFVARGYYDLTTPYFATQYTIDQLGLDKTLKDNITLSSYEAGHQLYVHVPSLKKFTSDVAAFIDKTLFAE